MQVLNGTLTRIFDNKNASIKHLQAHLQRRLYFRKMVQFAQKEKEREKLILY